MIEACLACLVACEATAADSIKKSDSQYIRCIELCRDCIELCQLCVKLDIRKSEYQHSIMKVCIENCLQCAAECERFPNSQYHIASAKACLTCAQEMQKMMN